MPVVLHHIFQGESLRLFQLLEQQYHALQAGLPADFPGTPTEAYYPLGRALSRGYCKRWLKECGLRKRGMAHLNYSERTGMLPRETICIS